MKSQAKLTKTKILCTLGPATSTAEMIEGLIYSGMDGVRLNFSHGDYEQYERLYEQINIALKTARTPLAFLIDLQGPKIRIGNLEKPEIEIFTGEYISITVDDVIGTKDLISCSYKPLVDDASVGDPILINDGLIRLRVFQKVKNTLKCLIEVGGIIKPKKGMNLPGMKLSTASITEKDFQDLEFALKHNLDYIALSFVRCAQDIIDLRNWLTARGINKKIIAKIEKKEALDDFDAILEAADGIMVARGDLGVEMLPQEVPVIQKTIIKKCNSVGKLVITATQMLESMIENPIPTRAEASDVANAVWDGSDVVMLSGETSVGKYPFRTVQIMNDIILNAESHSIPIQDNFYKLPLNADDNVFDSFNRAIVSISNQINAKAILALTYNGKTALAIAKYRPKAKIIALSNSFDTMNKLCLGWGITSIFMQNIDKEQLIITEAKEKILKEGILSKGDAVIFTSSTPYQDKSRTNWIKFEII